MKISYIHHCCFSIELENSVLLFDYFKGSLPVFPSNKQLYVFATHNHHDHFNKAIFKLAEQYPNVIFILSDDIPADEEALNKYNIADASLNINSIGPNVSASFGDGKCAIELSTLESTDEGVAFMINTEGKTIYHAGDLNLWTWIGEPEEDNRLMAERFYKEMDKIKGRHIDVAFMTLDPRQEEMYAGGFDYFMRNCQVDKVYPMHCWEDYSIIDRLLTDSISEGYRHKVVKYSPIKK